MDLGRLILLGETGEFRSFGDWRKSRRPQLQLQCELHQAGEPPGSFKSLNGVSSTHHPIYYHQNNAENHQFQWY
jgi:hypothetical protein